METDKRSRLDSLADAANARQEAKQFRHIADELDDAVIGQSLIERAAELEAIALALEAQARTGTPRH